MDTLALQKYETQLANIWRLWSEARRFSKLLIMTDLRNVGSIIKMANMFLSNRKFWATNNPRYLSNALQSYFSLRDEWVNESHGGSNTGLEISGWADKATFSRLRETLSSFRLRRVFRPDVWYLKGGKGGLFSGFVFEVDISEFAGVAQELKKSVPELQMSMPNETVTKLDKELGGRLESINPLQKQRGLNWFSTFSVSPREFTWLVEAAADKEVAALALSFYKQFGGFEFHGETLRCIAKYCLILDEIPPGITLNGWSMKAIEKPSWIYSDSSEGSNAEKKNSRVSPKYTQLSDASITNGGVLLTEKGFVDWDSAQSPYLDFVAGNSNFVIGTNANLMRCFVRETQIEESFESGILLGSRVDSNWFHFLIETLPRLFYVDENVPPNIPILVSDRIPKTGLEALALVTDRKIQMVTTSKMNLVRRAYIPGPTVYHPDTQFLWNRDDQIEINMEVLSLFRNKVLAVLDVSEDLPTRSSFWYRAGGQRVVLNTQRLLRVIRAKKFEITNPALLDFVSQVKIVNESKTLVTSGGATMSNFIFANPKSRIIVLVSGYGLNYPVPKILAKTSGAELILLGGRARNMSSLNTVLEKSHASFRISLFKLVKVLKEK